MNNEFLREITKVDLDLRAPLIKFISDHVKEGDDLSDITKFLNIELQENLYLLDYLCEQALENEKLTPFEVKELILYLTPLDQTHRESALKKGLASALDNRKLN